MEGGGKVANLNVKVGLKRPAGQFDMCWEIREQNTCMGVWKSTFCLL